MATTQNIKISSNGIVSIPSEWSVAKITSVGTTQSGSGSCVGYPHAWIEQRICSNGVGYEDNPETGRTGTLTIQSAYAVDGSKASVNDLVLLRARAISNNGDTVYEFFKGGSGGGTPVTMDCPHVSSVQCTGGLLIVTYDTTCVAP
jgi:hypothetical protein